VIVRLSCLVSFYILSVKEDMNSDESQRP